MGYLLKFLVFFIVIWTVISFIKRLTSSENDNETDSASNNPEPMIKCAICDVYTPKSKVSEESGKTICSNCSKNNQNSPD